MTLDNLTSWSLQILVIAGAGTLLPLLCRLRDAGSLLRYYQAVLGLCLLLPVIQPWTREIIVEPAGMARGVGPVIRAQPSVAPPLFTLEQAALGALAGGACLRALWMIAGLLRLRKFRRDARPLYPLPPAVQAARDSAGTDALVCLTDAHTGPVTFGLRVPVILLPPRFLNLPGEAQFAVACHEFLHVRRRDWLHHMIEEAVSILLWFHPAVWWLVSRIRLSREQAVDREVLRLTHARDPYVQALLAMAGTRPSLDLVPAPLFLRRRHLKERIFSIAKEVTMSKRRLVSSYVSMSAVLAGATWMAVAFFPLRGLPQVQPDSADQLQRKITELKSAPPVSQDGPGISVDPGGVLMHRGAVHYPADAMRARVQGAVVLDLTLDSQGNVIDARVISGPDQLRRAALASALQWHYSKERAGSHVQATIEFTLPANAPTGPPPPPPPPFGEGKLLGVTYINVPREIAAQIQPKVEPFVGRQLTHDVTAEVRAAIQDVDPHLQMVWRAADNPGGAYDRHLHLIMGSFTEGVPPPPPPPVDFGPAPHGTQRIRVGGNVQSAKLTQRVPPEYPPLARQARIQGTVRFAVLVGKEGDVKAMQLISGHPLLVKNATEAVQQWKYQTTLLNGNPVEVQTVVDINFTLTE